MDELAEKIARITSELESALGEQKGRIEVEGEYPEEIVVSGDRVGYARFAIELLKVATPENVADGSDVPGPDDRLLLSPIADYHRSDTPAPAATGKTKFKDRLVQLGCILFGAFAVVSFFRGCAALQNDLERLMK